MSTVRSRMAELRTLVDEVAAPGWTSSPAWWALLGAVAVAEPFGRPGAYLVSDAEPRADTFMGVPGPAPDDAAGRIGWAIAAAHAAVRAVIARDGTLPEQPLTVGIALHRGAARAVPIASPWRVAFALRCGVMTALLDPRGPAHDVGLARVLAEAVAADLRGEPRTAMSPRPPAVDEPTPMVCITLGDDDLSRAHHGHRRAWHAAGGPWLGIARAGGLTVLSTCHMIVDGFGHAALTTDLARGIDRTAARTLASAAAQVLGSATLAVATQLSDESCGRLGVAWRRIPGRMAPVLRQAWVLGRLLFRDAGNPRALRSPVFQVPVAPGAPDDPTRFARRVKPALLSVRFSDGVAEPEAVFAKRARAAIAREAQGRGLTSHLLTALTALPAPLGWKRRVVGTRSKRFGEVIDVIAGTGCLSSMRAHGAPPLVAVSSPAQLLDADEATATSVLTVVDDGEGATVTLAGSGRATSTACAEELLDDWCRDLASAATATRPMLG